MADNAIDVYLNDHLAGAMLGSDLAEQIEAQNHGTALGELMESLAPQIEQDRQTLIELMQQMESSKNPVKQATAWIAEKASRAKFNGMTSGEPELGTFMALETLALGVQGKACLWKSLQQVADQHPPIASMNLDELIERAHAQYAALEHERLAAGARALANHSARPRDRAATVVHSSERETGRTASGSPLR
jgi:hypothetical protein